MLKSVSVSEPDEKPHGNKSRAVGANHFSLVGLKLISDLDNIENDHELYELHFWRAEHCPPLV